MDIASLRMDEEIKEIYIKYIDMFYCISFLMLKNHMEAEDAAQTDAIRKGNKER